MTSTTLDIRGEDFYINGHPTYTEIPGAPKSVHGLLMNARFIQGIFDDRAHPEHYERFGRGPWDPEANTDALIANLPQWYAHGLRAFTVGLQGGGPCFTVNGPAIDNNPFGKDGKTLDPAYAARLDRLIRAADALGMVVIVSYFYGLQALRLRDGRAVRSAVTVASRFLRDQGYGNVIIEIANEYNVGQFEKHPLIQTPAGAATLIDLAKVESGGLAVGCSGSGGVADREICEASDVLIIHGNGCSRQRYYNLIAQVREWSPGKPVLCNEDSQAIGQLAVAAHTHSSWGYYNNTTKQEPPTDWSITAGEDTFFALRMAMVLGIEVEEPSDEDQYYFQGLEKNRDWNGKRWLRLASLYPETIDYVEFYRDDALYYTAYDEPFSVHFHSNWRQGAVEIGRERVWRASIQLRSGQRIEKSVELS